MKLAKIRSVVIFFALLASLASAVGAQDKNSRESERGAKATVGRSAVGPQDQLGRLSLMTNESRAAILSRIAPGRVYDLAVPFFIGMPAYTDAGDQPFQYWTTHTPSGNIHDDPSKVGEQVNRIVTYTGDAMSLYTHTGTHIDSLAHFGLHGMVWNGFKWEEHLGDRGWDVNGADKIPPIIARGVLIDVPALKGTAELPNGYRITAADIRAALARQRVALARGDVVLVRTGRMAKFRDAKAYSDQPAGLGLDAAQEIARAGAMIVGVDVQNPDVLPSGIADNYMPVHTFFLGENGILILENVDTETISKDRVYEFAFIGTPLKIEGATGSPLRPLALPLRAR